jgi:hypothetical protein
MANYRFLNAWAEREQRRFDQQRANPRLPGTESRRLRILQASLTVFNMVAKFAILFPLYIFWIAKLIAQHTVQSLALAVALLALFSFSAFTTGYAIRARRASGMNWLTGLAPRVRVD